MEFYHRHVCDWSDRIELLIDDVYFGLRGRDNGESKRQTACSSCPTLRLLACLCCHPPATIVVRSIAKIAAMCCARAR